MKLEKLAKESNLSPMDWLLKEAFHAVTEAHQQVILEKDLAIFNPLEEIKNHVKTDRLEVYIEIFNGYDLDELMSVMEGVLRRYIKQPKQKRRGIQASFDDGDHDAFLAWLVPQDKVNSGFKKGGKPFKFKIYKKNDRLRFEIQANFPNLVKPTDRNLVDPYIALAMDAQKIAGFLATLIEKVWAETLHALTAFDPKYHLYDLVEKRIKEILPVKGRHPNARAVAMYIADNGYITLNDLKTFSWSRNDLRAMANKTYGFLTVRDCGFNLAADVTKKRIIGGIYDLHVEHLDRIGRPRPSVNSEPTTKCIHSLAIDPLQASGTALAHIQSAFCTYVKSIHTTAMPSKA